LRTYWSAQTSKPLSAWRTNGSAGFSPAAPAGRDDDHGGAATFPLQAQGTTGCAVACHARRCSKNASRAADVSACHFGCPVVVAVTRGQFATCHRRADGSMTKPAPAAAISRSLLLLAILRTPSIGATPPGHDIVAMTAIMDQRYGQQDGSDTNASSGRRSGSHHCESRPSMPPMPDESSYIAESGRTACRLASRGASGHINRFWVSLPWMGGPFCRIGWVLGAELWSPVAGVPARTSA
jgi:hypothetical protein